MGSEPEEKSFSELIDELEDSDTPFLIGAFFVFIGLLWKEYENDED